MKRFVLIVFVLIISAGVMWRVTHDTKNIQPQSLLSPLTAKIPNLPTPTPTSMPFGEMTIPHLREREFVSSLGQRRVILENGVYTSYVTSYDSDGLRVNGLLTIPKNETSPAEGWPAIVFVHGYIPPAQYRTTGNYVSYVDYFARRGFVVFKIDLRGHDQSEGEAGGGYYSSDYVIDTLNARAALLGSDFVKPNAVGLWGHSMAGNVVMRAAVARPEIPAVVVWAGAGYTYKDLQDYRISDASYQPPAADSQRVLKRQMLRQIHGDFSESSSFWKQVAVTDYLKDLKGAIELHHAGDDGVVSIEYSRNLARLLKNAGTIYNLHEYQSGGHNLTGATFTSAMEQSAKFFSKYL